MTYFYLLAATLVVVALALLLRPWWSIHRSASRRGASTDSSRTLNVAIHRDRLHELECDHANGTLSDADLAEAREELQRQLLDDTAAIETVKGRTVGRAGGMALALLLPVIAAALYIQIGSPRAMLPGEMQTQRAAADMQQLVAKLEKKLADNPQNPEGWAMLARSYKSVGRWNDAERAFARIGPDLEKNAGLLAELAEALAQRDQGFGERPKALIQKALHLEPNNMLALFLGGSAAFEGGRYADAAALWGRLLPQLEPGSEDARMVESSIAEARERSGGAASVLAGAVAPQDEVHRAASNKGKTADSSAAKASGKSVSGRVELSAGVKAKANPDDIVFIFARAVDGPRMPLAAQRARVADLPLDFMLGDGQALMPEATISSVAQLRIEVRISKSGKAQPSKGDLTGKSAVVKPGAKGLRVVVDQIES